MVFEIPSLWLAPMEGITDRCFRELSVTTNRNCIGSVSTEFIRVTSPPIKVEKFVDELGNKFAGPLHGIQLMGNKPDMMAQSAINAATAGADYVDLNFGCPAPRVYQHCAGSALLDNPTLLGEVVTEVVAACPVPVTAKIRGGGENDLGLEGICEQIEQAGAQAICVHGRLRTEKYTQPCDWNRIKRAVESVSIPVIGNGGIDCHEDIARMQEQTGCAAVMIGRAALANPWIFSGAVASHSQRIEWISVYSTMMQNAGATERQCLGRLKQAIKYMCNAKHLTLESGLANCLRAQDLESFLALLHH